jgi:hypothetical protein
MTDSHFVPISGSSWSKPDNGKLTQVPERISGDLGSLSRVV